MLSLNKVECESISHVHFHKFNQKSTLIQAVRWVASWFLLLHTKSCDYKRLKENKKNFSDTFDSKS